VAGLEVTVDSVRSNRYGIHFSPPVPELFARISEKEMNITSDEWIQRDEFKSEGMVIVDADGWDRHNFQFSFYEEKIDREEFLKRYMMSSIAPKGSGYQCVSDLCRPKTETSINGQEYLN
jgi:hypothetical protein